MPTASSSARSPSRTSPTLSASEATASSSSTASAASRSTSTGSWRNRRIGAMSRGLTERLGGLVGALLLLSESAWHSLQSPGPCVLDGEFLWVVEKAEDETSTIKKYRVP